MSKCNIEYNLKFILQLNGIYFRGRNEKNDRWYKNDKGNRQLLDVVVCYFVQPFQAQSQLKWLKF